MTTTTTTPTTTTVVATAAAAVALGAAAASVAARRRAALADAAASPSAAFPASSAAAAARWNAQNPSPVFQLVVFRCDDSDNPGTLIFHPRRGALADLLAAAAPAVAAGANSPTPLRLFLSLSRTGKGPFVELAPSPSSSSSPTALGAEDPDAAALGALEEATGAAKHVAVVFAVPADPSAAAAIPRSHPGLVDVPFAPGALPVLGHAMLAARGPYMQPMYNFAHHLFFKQQQKQGSSGTAASSSAPDTLRLHLPAMNAPRGVLLHPERGDDPLAWRTALMTRDPRVVAELLAREDVWPKKFDRPPQELLRDFAGPGLFTSSSDEPDWQTAHGVLPRLFNALRVTAMFPAVMTKTRAFVARWAALLPPPQTGSSSSSSSPSNPPFAIIDHASDWLTSMTIDAVVLAAVGTDMKNVERLAEHRPLHPFITAFRFGLGYAVGNVSAAQEFGPVNAYLNPLFDSKSRLKRKYLESKRECEEIVAALVEQTRNGELRGAGGQPNVIAAMMSDRSTSDGSLVPVTSFYGHMINIM
jgi:hypothetical protein